MANIKIAQLTNATTISDTDIVLIEDATQTKKMTVATLKSLLGINSGGIIDSGSNANGKYVKFADGTMICYVDAYVSKAVNVAQGAVFTEAVTVTFPATFFTPPIVSSNFNGGYYVIGTSLNPVTNDSVTILLYTATSLTVSGGLHIIAIGRHRA